MSLISVRAHAQTARYARYAHTMTLLADSSVLITGGIGPDGIPISSATIFRSTDGLTGPGLDGYEAITDMQVTRASHTATMLPDGRVFVFGGVSSFAPFTMANTAEIYNPVTGAWNQFAAPDVRFNHTATLLHTGKVLIAGGQTDAAGTVTNTCALFNPATDGFDFCKSPVAGQVRERAGHSATLLQDGRVFIAGGYYGTASTSFTVTTAFYTPGAGGGDWVPGPPLIQKRAWHTATQLGNFKVAIVGGYHDRNVLDNFGILESVELYDPITNGITPAGPMKARRMNHTAALAGDGKLYIMNGFGNFTTSYFSGGGAPFALGSVLTLRASNPITNSTVTVRGTDNVGFFEAIGPVELSIPTAGIIVNGQIAFSSPQINTSIYSMRFDFPLTSGSLAGNRFEMDTTIAQNAVIKTLTAVTTFNGQGFFFPFDTTMGDNKTMTGGDINLAAPVQPGGGGLITGGSITLPALISLPSFAVPGSSIFQGSARIVSAQLQRPNNPEHGFQAALSSGTAEMDGSTCPTATTCNLVNGCRMLCTLTFNGIEGTITSSSPTAPGPLTDPIPWVAPGDDVTGMQLNIQMTMDAIDISGQNFDFDIATITVREAVFADREIYSPQNNTWQTPNLGGLPRFNHASVLMPNGDIFSYGGRRCVDKSSCEAGAYIPNNSSNILIPISSGWTAGDQLGAGRSNHTATLLPSGHVLVAGGAFGPLPLRDTELYDPVADQWETVGALNVPRAQHTTTLLPNSMVLTAGGFTSASSTSATETAELYYRDTKIWLPTSSMNGKRSNHTATLLADGNVLVFGGVDASGSFLNTGEIYHSTNRTWVPITNADTARARHTASLLHDGRVLVVGGVNGLGVLGAGNNPGERAWQIYDPATDNWSSPGGPGFPDVLSYPRHSHAAVTTNDGRVMVAGGNDGFGEVGNTAFFDPRTDQWQEIPIPSDMVIPRQNHAMLLLPNHNVLVTGGFTALGVAQDISEIYDIAFATWTAYGLQTVKRGNHSTVLLKDNRVLNVGGFDGITDQDSTGLIHFSVDPDAATPPPSLRLPFLTSVDTGTFLPGSPITLIGGNFLGKTQAGGGGAASANSDHNHPRVILRALDSGGNNSSGATGFSVDLTTQILNNQTFGFPDILAKWSKIDSSITVPMLMQDLGAGPIPYGYYELRVGANSQYSEGLTVQVGPAKGPSIPGLPVGTAVGVSSVSWSFPVALGTPDGYNIYSATSGIFIATMTAGTGNNDGLDECGSATIPGRCVFVQRGLGTDTAALIKVAAYTISGDGNLSIATVPVNTVSGDVVGLAGVALSTGDISWNWAVTAAATDYWVYQSTSGNFIGSVVNQWGFLRETFYTSGHSTNTAISVRVQARTLAGPGTLSAPVTTYTLAAPPIPGFPPLTSVSTGGFLAQWAGGTNPSPPETSYTFQYTSDLNPSWTIISGATDFSYAVSGTSPNELFTASVTAVNGDGIATLPFVDMGSTATFAEAPVGAFISAFTPSSLTVVWGANGNPSTTTYQVLMSTDSAFVVGVTTPVPFSSQLRQTTTTISSLLTDTTYNFRISAQNQFGRETAYTATSGLTFGGGGPPGSLSTLVPTNQLTTLSGNLASGRRVELLIPSGTFENEVRIFITSQSVLNCGPINSAISVTTLPPLQPVKPFFLSLSFNVPEPGIYNDEKLVLARYDPIGNTCVSQPGKLDRPNSMIRAEVNHLSDFQLRQIPDEPDLANARVFPNPLHTRNQGFFTFDHLPPPTWIRIYTLHGERVARFISNAAGVAIWKAVNEHLRPVASGVYLAVLEHEGEKKKIMKIVVIR